MTLASPQGQSCCGTGHLKRPAMLGRCLRHVGAIQRQLAGAAHHQVHLRCMATVSKADTRAKLLRESPADPTAEAKAKALEAVLKDMNARFGKGSIMQLGSTVPSKVECIPSGALTLDIALGGGIPKGRIIEVFGPESSGKTTLALHAIAAVQKQGGTALLVDAEHAFDPMYSKRAGVDIDKLLMCQPDSGEMALEIVDQMVRSSAVDIIAVDSVAALVPRAELEGEIGAVQVGSQARLMSAALRKLTANASKCNCTVIFLNQLRSKIGQLYGNPEVTSGGNALKFYSSVRCDVRRKQTIEGAKGEMVGIRVKAKIVKNKCAPPYKIAEFDIMFGSGISVLGCLLDAAEGTEVVQRKGSWYSFGETRLAQGRDKTLVMLQENPELAALYSFGETRLAQGRDKTLVMLQGNPELAAEVEQKTRQALGQTDINDMYEKMGEDVEGEFQGDDSIEEPEEPLSDDSMLPDHPALMQ